MQSIKLLLSTTVLSLGFLASCSSDEIPVGTEANAPEGATVFGSDITVDTLKEELNKRQTLATMTHNKGQSAKFAWSQGDNLWVQLKAGDKVIGKTAGNWVKERWNNIPQGGATHALFFYDGDYKSNQYNVLFNANPVNPSDPTRVNIPAAQQSFIRQPFDHLSESGDCGYAVANKSGKQYKFNITHAPAYLCFYPIAPERNGYQREPFRTGLINKIEVTTSTATPLAGEFGLTPNGLVGDTGSKKVTLTYNREAPGLAETRPHFIVIRPGTHTLTVKYTVQILEQVRFSTKRRLKIYEATKTFGARNYEKGKIYDITATLKESSSTLISTREV